MKALITAFHISFWLFMFAFALVLSAIFGHVSAGPNVFTNIAAYGLPLCLFTSIAYAICLWVVADKYGKQGWMWAALAFVFGPIGAIASYVNLRPFIKSAPLPAGPVNPGYTAGQNKWHLKLVIGFVIFLVLANVVARFLK